MGSFWLNTQDKQIVVQNYDKPMICLCGCDSSLLAIGGFLITFGILMRGHTLLLLSRHSIAACGTALLKIFYNMSNIILHEKYLTFLSH